MIRSNFSVKQTYRLNAHNTNRLTKPNKEQFSLKISNEVSLPKDIGETNPEATGSILNYSEIVPPTTPKANNYTKTVTYPDGLKETILDEEAYKQAMETYLEQKKEYDNNINIVNQQIIEQQEQDAINSMQQEWDLFNQRFDELNQELNVKGTGSKRMSAIMEELKNEYETFLNEKMIENIKITDSITNISIPNPPIKTDSMSESEYKELYQKYNLERLSFEKIQLENEMQRQISEIKIGKIDSELELIRKMLFGNTDLTQHYYINPSVN